MMRPLAPLALLALTACQTTGTVPSTYRDTGAYVAPAAATTTAPAADPFADIDLTTMTFRERLGLLVQVNDELESRYGVLDKRDVASRGLSIASFVPAVGLIAAAANVTLNMSSLSTRDLRALADKVNESLWADIAEMLSQGRPAALRVE